MRVIVLGCGTGVGKTRVSVALVRELTARGQTAVGLKPIESGLEIQRPAPTPPTGSDAFALSAVGSVRLQLPHPLYALREPVSPHLAARAAGMEIDLNRISRWVSDAEAEMALHALPRSVQWTIIETAGGVFSPLGPLVSNFELARSLEPATWVLVAADALGVLHEVTSTLKALRACGREPDHLVLSGAREPDASTGTNSAELATLGIAKTSAVLARNDDRGVTALLDVLLQREQQVARAPG